MRAASMEKSRPSGASFKAGKNLVLGMSGYLEEKAQAEQALDVSVFG